MPRRSRALDRAAAAGTRRRGRPPAGRREHRVRFWEAIARGCIKRERCRGGGCLAERWCPVVSQGWRHAVSHPRAGVWALSVLHRAGGDRGPARSVVVGCERSRVSWVVRRRRSPGSCNATQRSAPAGRSIGPRPPRRMLTVAPDDRSRRSSRSTRSCGPMCRPGFPGLCSGPTGALRVRRSAGAGGVTDRERTGAGDSVGVRSRSPVACALTSPMMSRCVFPMRRSISRCMCRAAERCAGS